MATDDPRRVEQVVAHGDIKAARRRKSLIERRSRRRCAKPVSNRWRFRDIAPYCFIAPLRAVLRLRLFRFSFHLMSPKSLDLLRRRCCGPETTSMRSPTLVRLRLQHAVARLVSGIPAPRALPLAYSIHLSLYAAATSWSVCISWPYIN